MKKYIKTFESFKNNKNEPVNEEFLGAIGKWLGNMFKKAQENIRKTQGGEEVEAIYQKYLKMITDKLQAQAGVTLNLVAAKKEAVKEGKINEAEEVVAEPEATEVEPEAENKPTTQDSKMSAESLTKKSAEMDKIVLAMKTMALKEMDAVLKNKGGATKNPKLQTIIDIKKSQFDLDFMNAKIGFYEKSGDKTMVSKISKERDVVAKTIETGWKTFEKPVEKPVEKSIEYKEGDKVKYKRKDGSENQAEFIKIDGDDVTLKTEKNPNGFAVKKDSLLGKVEIQGEGQSKAEEEPKEGTESTEETTKEGETK